MESDSSSTVNENPWPHLNDYVKFVSRSGEQLLFECKRCSSKKTTIKVHISSLNNLKQHMKRVHESQYTQFEETVKAGSNRGKPKRKISDINTITTDDKRIRQICIGEFFDIATIDSGANQTFENLSPEVTRTEKDNKFARNGRASSKEKSNEEKITDAYAVIMEAKNRLENNRVTDEFDVYATYVASELRNIKDEYSTLIAKKHINNILIEARMGNFCKKSNVRDYSVADTSTPGPSKRGHLDRTHQQSQQNLERDIDSAKQSLIIQLKDELYCVDDVSDVNSYS